MRERYIFTLCVSPHLDREGGGVPCLWGGGGTPTRSGWLGGVPQPGLDGGGGTPARSGWGGYPSQVWMVGGIPRPGLERWGTPLPGLDGGVVPGVPPWPGLDGGGTPASSGWWGVPQVPPPTRIASTCYAAGGMPLAFTQEEFLFQKCEGMLQPEYKKMSVDPELTSFDILIRLLAKAFNIKG